MVPSALAAIALVWMQAQSAAGQPAAHGLAEAAPAGSAGGYGGGAGAGMGYGSGYGELLVVSLVLVAVVAVLAIVVVRSFAGRGFGRRGGGLLEVIARQPLEPRRSLYVVRAGTRTLLVGTSELGVTMLTELEGVLPAASDDARQPLRAAGQGASFAELVRQAALRWGQRRRARQAGDGAGQAEGAEAEGTEAGEAAGSSPEIAPVAGSSARPA